MTRRSVVGPRPVPVQDGAVAVYGISLRGDEAPSDFGRLILIARSNERHIEQLGALNGRIDRARTHLARLEGDARVERAYLEHLKMKRSGLLAQLRANRVEAEQILGGPGRRGAQCEAVG